MPGRSPGTTPPVIRITSVLPAVVVEVEVVVELLVQESMSGWGGPLTSLQVLLEEVKQEQVLSWARLKLNNV